MRLINRKKDNKVKVNREALSMAFVEEASEAFFIFDSNLYGLEMNNVALALVGKERSQIIGSDIKELLPNWGKDDRFQAFRDVIRTGEPLRFRDYVLNATTGNRLFDVAAFKLKSGLGILLYDANTRNLKTATELSLEANSEAILKVMHESFLVLDSNNRVINANENFYKHFTFKPEQVIGELIFDLGETQWDLPEFHELLEFKLSRVVGMKNIKVQGYFQGLGERILNINARLFDHESEDKVIILLAIDDVTKLSAQRESLKKMADIYAHAPDPIILTDLKGDIIELNAEAEELYGWPKPDLLEKSFKTIVPSDFRDQYDELLRTVIADGQVRNIEIKHWTNKGQAIPVQMRMHLLQNSAEENIGTVAYIHHIPSQSKAERAVRRWRDLYLKTSDAVVYFDLTGSIKDLNPAAEAAFNWPKTGLVGKPATILIHEDDHKKFATRLSNLQGSSHTEEFDFQRLGPKGTSAFTRSTLYQLPDASNTPGSIAMVVEHISDEEKAAKAYRQIVKNFLAISDAVIVENLSGEVIDMNKAAERLYGWSRKDLIGKPAKSLVPVDQQKQAGEWMAQARNGEVIQNVSCRRWTKSGNFFSAILTIFQMTDIEGKVTGIIAITRLADGAAAVMASGIIDMKMLFVEHADPIVVEDLGGNIMDLNQAAIELLGWGSTDLLKRPFKTILPTDQHKQLEKIRLLWKKKIPIRRAEIKIWSKTGEIYPMSLSMIQCKDANGAAVGIANIFQDISEYKQLQALN